MKNYFFLILAMCTIIAAANGQTKKSFDSSDYDKLLKKSDIQVQEFINTKDALAQAETAYLEAINSFASTQETTNLDKKGTKSNETKIDWMKNMAPLYVSAVDNKKDIKERIDLTVNSFSSSFQLDNSQKTMLVTQLNNYVVAYKNFQANYSSLGNILTFGPGESKSMPLPSQMHQVHQVHQVHQNH